MVNTFAKIGDNSGLLFIQTSSLRFVDISGKVFDKTSWAVIEILLCLRSERVGVWKGWLLSPNVQLEAKIVVKSFTLSDEDE